MINDKLNNDYVKLYPIIFPFLAFWDFYVSGIRLLDIISLFIILLLLCSSFIFNGYKISFQKPRQIILLNAFSGLCLGLSLWGILQSDENFKPVLGFISGVIIFNIFYISPIEKNVIKYTIIPYLIICISFFYIQDIYYYTSGGKILHPLYMIGEQPRAVSSIFRPTSFYLEPANYCLSIFMLILLADKYKILTNKIYAISALSILLSISLWGYVSILIFTLTRYLEKSKWAFIIAVSVLALIAAVFLLAKGSNPLIDFTINRLTHISSDSSGGARYGGIKLIRELGATDPSFWFGTGVSNDYIKYGSNGLAFILNAGGLLGVGLIYLLLFFLCSSGGRMKFVFYFSLILTAAPLWSVFFWWAWLALMLKNQSPLSAGSGTQAPALA